MIGVLVMVDCRRSRCDEERSAVRSTSEVATDKAAHADDVIPAEAARYVALIRIDVERAGVSLSRRRPVRKSGVIAAHRQLLGSLVKQTGAGMVSTGLGSVTVELGAPSRALSFASDVLRVLAMRGLEAKAALHVGWMTWTGGACHGEALRALQDAIDVARSGHIVATEQFRMLLHADGRAWSLLDELDRTSPPVYELEGKTAAGSGAVFDAAIRRRRLGSLSRREREVVGLVAAGKSNREVASALRIAPSTVERHVSNVFGKLDVDSRVAVAVIAASGQL
jgi:DNA-binding CsgD family transcriptional regulator